MCHVLHTLIGKEGRKVTSLPPPSPHAGIRGLAEKQSDPSRNPAEVTLETVEGPRRELQGQRQRSLQSGTTQRGQSMSRRAPRSQDPAQQKPRRSSLCLSKPGEPGAALGRAWLIPGQSRSAPQRAEDQCAAGVSAKATARTETSKGQ